MKDLFKVKDADRLGYGVFADVDIPEGAVILDLLKNSTWRAESSRTSIQMGQLHIESPVGSYVNHHCRPSSKIVLLLKSLKGEDYIVPTFVGITGSLTSVIFSDPKPVLIATKDIKKGEEITFNYKETEDVITNPFYCACCNKKIIGKTELRIDYEGE
tara:strand:+ start:785 stop:1258 length:474 start_codon:yes stop_codon:yes gene_type:complete